MEKDYELQITADPDIDLDQLEIPPDERGDAEALKARMQALDERIARALEIDVPELRQPDLPPVADDNVVAMPGRDGSGSRRRGFLTPAWIGIAASIVLVAAIGARFLGPDPRQVPLSAQIIDHLQHEPGALEVTSEPVPDGRLRRVVRSGNASIDRDVGLITYARSCVINRRQVPHLVMQGENGPITLLLMPDESVAGAEVIEGESIEGVVLPVGEGSIAIIGNRGEDLDAIRQRVVDSVTWSI